MVPWDYPSLVNPEITLYLLYHGKVFTKQETKIPRAQFSCKQLRTPMSVVNYGSKGDGQGMRRNYMEADTSKSLYSIWSEIQREAPLKRLAVHMQNLPAHPKLYNFFFLNGSEGPLVPSREGMEGKSAMISGKYHTTLKQENKRNRVLEAMRGLFQYLKKPFPKEVF